jgi:TonB family protein
LEYQRKNQERLAEDRALERQARQESRTNREVIEGLSRLNGDFAKIFRRHRVEQNGKLVVNFTIAPSGEITDVQMVLSEFRDSAIEGEVIDLVRTLRFEARNVPTFTSADYPIAWSINP